MTKLEYTFKNDTLFKMLFVKYPDLLKRLVAVLLGIRLESIGQFEITNPEMPHTPAYHGDFPIAKNLMISGATNNHLKVFTL